MKLKACPFQVCSIFFFHAPSTTVHGRPARSLRARRSSLFRAAHGRIHARRECASVLRNLPLRRRVRRLVSASNCARARVLVRRCVPLHSRSRRARTVHAKRQAVLFNRPRRPRRTARLANAKRPMGAAFCFFFEKKTLFFTLRSKTILTDPKAVQFFPDARFQFTRVPPRFFRRRTRLTPRYFRAPARVPATLGAWAAIGASITGLTVVDPPIDSEAGQSVDSCLRRSRDRRSRRASRDRRDRRASLFQFGRRGCGPCDHDDPHLERL